MKSVLCLGCCPQPMKPLCIPSPMRAAPGAKLHFSLNLSFFHLSSGSTRCPQGRVIRPVIYALDKSSRPSTTDKGDNKVVRGTVGVSLVLACALGIIGCVCKMNPTAIAGPREMYQKAPPTREAIHPMGGKAALKSLLDVSVNLASSKVEPSKGSAFRLPPRPSKEHIDKLKMEAIRQMKSGKTEEAVQLLRKAYKDCKHDPEPAYNVEMTLVEILICQGKYQEALECNCLKDSQRLPSDDRFPLYKAIIYTMLDRKEEAKEYWEEFADTVVGGFDPRNFGN